MDVKPYRLTVLRHHWHCFMCSYCHNIISSGSPPVLHECTSFNRWRKVRPVWQYTVHVRDGVERYIYQKWARMRLVLVIFTQMPAVSNWAGVFSILFKQRNWIWDLTEVMFLPSESGGPIRKFRYTLSFLIHAKKDCVEPPCCMIVAVVEILSDLSPWGWKVGARCKDTEGASRGIGTWDFCVALLLEFSTWVFSLATSAARDSTDSFKHKISLDWLVRRHWGQKAQDSVETDKKQALESPTQCLWTNSLQSPSQKILSSFQQCSQ